ncbi:uncharacterized protein IL334_006694 [Kwoniella shivajii]|uniref:Protein kinase domain-containing protein n=1 Tax=Kwoniella shivajii TaxID=564305 RepID=A0ABZ1D8C3_9TREE|nr:hypothetical protein IL334_006694 [Kwoniella shivajii]
MSDSSTYAHRQCLLLELLDQQQPVKVSDLVSRFTTSVNLYPIQDGLSIALDAVLLEAWSRQTKQTNHDHLRYLNTLRLDRTDFDILGRLGDGQFGTVDAARSRLNGQVYAIKTIKKHTAMRAGSQLSLNIERLIHMIGLRSVSPPIPALIAAFQTEDCISLVTTFAECGSLWDRLCSLSVEDGQPGIMMDSEIKWWAPQMIEAIQWVHDQGYVHRDVKPHNFLVTAKSRILLTDFGSAAPLQFPKDSHARRPFVLHDQCIMPIGTPDYIAPEILLIAEAACVEATESDLAVHPISLQGYDLSVDWWSLGATLYEMATGRGPFWSRTIQQTYLLLTRYKGNIELPSSIHSTLREVLYGIAAPPSSFAHPEPFDLSALPIVDTSVIDPGDFTFNHLFEQSTSYNDSCSATSTSTLASFPDVLYRWLGWTWEPPPAMLENSRVDPNFANSYREHIISSPADFTTPVRPRDPLLGGLMHTGATLKPMVPGSHIRSRLVSERQAFAELVLCVQKSAKKQVSTKALPSDQHILLSNRADPATPTRDISLKDNDRSPSMSTIAIHQPLHLRRLEDLELQHYMLSKKLEVSTTIMVSSA